MPMLTGIWKVVCEAADAAGRDSTALRLTIRTNPVFTDTPAPAETVPRQGTLEQFAGYVRAVAEAGADELMVDLQQTTTSTAELLERAQQIIDAVGDLR